MFHSSWCIAVAHCVHWCFTQADSFSHPRGKSCRAETRKQNKTKQEKKSQSLLISVVSMVSGPVLKKLNILWSKKEFVVTWELKAGLLNLFVFSSSFIFWKEHYLIPFKNILCNFYVQIARFYVLCFLLLFKDCCFNLSYILNEYKNCNCNLRFLC